MYKSKKAFFQRQESQKRRMLFALSFCILMNYLTHAQESIFEVWNQTNTSTVFTVNSFRSVTVDKRGIVWVGSDLGGLYKFDGESWEKYPITPGITYRHMETSPIVADSNLWTVSIGFSGVQATTGGVYYIKPEENGAMHYGSGLFGGLGSRYANSFVISNNVIYVALAQSLTGTTTNQGGIYKMSIVNPQQQTSSSFILAVSEPAGDIAYHSAGKRNNELWFGRGATCAGGCVAPRITRLDANGQPLSSITASNSPLPFTATASSPIARAIFTDTITGNTYVGLSGGAGVGVLKADGTWKMLTNENSNFPVGAAVNFNAINEVYGEVWIGTSHGIFIYNTSESLDSLKAFSLLTTEDGLPSNGVSDMAVDTMRGEIWVTTFAGVARMGLPKEGIKGTLFDVQINNSIKKDTVNLNGSIKKKAIIEDVLVELYEGETKLSTKEPDENGNFIFTETDPGHLYRILVRKSTAKGDIVVEHFSLTYDTLLKEIFIPDSLIKEIDHFGQFMAKRCFPAKMPFGWNSDLLGACRDGFFMGSYPEAYGRYYSSVFMDHQKQLDNLTNYYLSMVTLYDLGGIGSDLMGEAWLSGMNLVDYFFSKTTLGEKIFKRKDKLTAFGVEFGDAEVSVFVNGLRLIKENVVFNLKKQASLLPAGSPELENFNKFIDYYGQAMDMVILYIEKGGFQFGVSQLIESLKQILVAQATAMSYKNYARVRHSSTITTAAFAARNAKSTIEYPGAYGQLYAPGNTSLLGDARFRYTTLKQGIEQLRTAGKIAEAGGEILDAASVLGLAAGPLVSLTLKALATTAKAVRLGTGVAEISLGIGGCEAVEKLSDQVITKSGLKSAKPMVQRTYKSGVDIFLNDNNPQSLENIKNLYTQRLSEYKAIINAPYDSASSRVAHANLREAEENYFNSVSKTFKSMWAAADSANQIIDGWKDQYDFIVDTVIVNLDQLREEFFFTNLAHMVDPTSGELIPDLNKIIDSLIKWNNFVVPGVNNLAKGISDFGIATPANLIQDSLVLNFSNEPGDSGSFTYTFTNYGMMAMQGVYFKLTDKIGGFEFTSPDSIFVGPIAPGSRISISYSFVAPSYDTIGTYYLEIGASSGQVPIINGYLVSQTPVVENQIISIKNGNWNDPSTWNTNLIPTSISKVIINHQVTISSDVQCTSLQMNSAGEVMVGAGVKLDILNN